MIPTQVASGRRTKPPTSDESNAEVLLWQSTLRMTAALLFGVVAVMIMALEPARPSALVGVVVVLGYMTVISVIRRRVRSTGAANRDALVATVVADVLFTFALTYLASPPEYYGRALVVGFAILHLTEFYFGRSVTLFTLGAVAAAYLALLGVAVWAQEPFSWPQSLWSLAVFGLAGGSFILHYESFRNRLTTIVNLFDRAQEGDFAREYDVSGDVRPDIVTMVGRTYNRVRAQLANLVLTDPLSGCLNRRGLEQQLTREIARASRNGKPLALLAIDVDHFKEINDTYGHLAGDAVVQEVGTLLREVARTGDVVSRTGGDEFTLLLPDTTAAGAFRLAVRIRERVHRHAFPGLAGKVDVTVSIGLVSDKVADDNVAHDLHSRADEALYAAKGNGRNRVSIWTMNLRAIGK